MKASLAMEADGNLTATESGGWYARLADWRTDLN